MTKAIKALMLFILVTLTTSFYVVAAPLPDTGQTSCFSDVGNVINPCPQPSEPFYGQDANFSINPRSYTKLDALGNDLPDDTTSWSMVRDNVTGLIWEVKQSKDDLQDYTNPHDADNLYTWYDSNPDTNAGGAGTSGDGTDTEDFIQALNDANFGGHSDWRLPTVKEMADIADHGVHAPAINTAYFPNTLSLQYWSPNTLSTLNSYAWYFDFNEARISNLYKSYAAAVRAVRGEPTRLFGSMAINLDGTVTDTSTGLMWEQKTDDGTEHDKDNQYRWEDALAWVGSLNNANYKGYNDWRLPNKNELQSIVDYSVIDPAIDSIAFPNTVSSRHWSSTTLDSDTAYAWSVSFSSGGVYNHYSKFQSYSVRAVRGGQLRLLDHLVILAPKQGDRWEVGRKRTILWEPQGLAGNVTIGLSGDGGKTYETIETDTPNDGTYEWTVSGAASPNCMLKIVPLSAPSQYTTQGLFTIAVWSQSRRLPDTGQTGDYTATYGEDSDYSINPQSYIKLDTGGNDLPAGAVAWAMVRDNVTGLIWEVKQSKDDIQDYTNPHDADNAYTWYDANPETNGGDAGTPGEGTDTEDFIQALNDASFGGHSDWRLPTVKELNSIVNHDAYNPAINTVYFPGTKSSMDLSSYYWSATSYANQPEEVWNVHFYTNYYATGHVNKSDSYLVRAVRGGQPESLDKYILNGDETVTDTVTGLMWEQKTDNGNANDKDILITWEDALAWIENLNGSNYKGYSDWRLPNMTELQSIVEYEAFRPSVDATVFPNTVTSSYWSSTTRAAPPTTGAWAISFDTGGASKPSKAGNTISVRAVRGGQNRIPNHLDIVTPKQGERLEAGSTRAITWETQGIGGDVVIYLSRNGGKTYESIAFLTSNDGAYNWKVTGPVSANCILKIEPVNDPSKFTTQGLFRIATAASPVATISGTPSNPTSRTDADLTVGGEAIISYRYKIGNGNYSDEIILPAPIVLEDLLDDDYTVYLVGRNAAGDWQQTDWPTTVSWTVDTTPPDAPANLDLLSEDDSGNSDTDNKTQNTTDLTITGSGEEGAVFQLYDFGIDIYGATGTVVDGEFTIDISLAQGVHSISARQTDAAGNTSASSDSLEIVVDTSQPEVPLGIDLMATDDSGGSDSDNITQNISELTITGQGEVGSFIQLYDNGVEIPGATAIIYFFTFSIDLSLAPGSHSITAVQTDASGNASLPSAPLVIVIDDSHPNAPLVSGATPSKSDPPPTWTWSSGGGGDSGVYRFRLDNAILTGQPETVDESFTPSSILPERNHILYVQERDTAGNWSPTGDATIVVDSGAPCSRVDTVTLTDIESTATYTISSAYGDVYADEPVCEGAVSGTGVATIALHVIKPDGSEDVIVHSGGTLDDNFLYLPSEEGPYSFYTTATDNAGNLEAAPGAPGYDKTTFYADAFTGYAILAVGSIDGSEGIEAHTQTANQVYAHLINRNFALVADSTRWDDPYGMIMYFNPYWESQTGEDDFSDVEADNYWDALRKSITEWAPNNMQKRAGPLYIIMIDHGTPGKFYLNSLQNVTPIELNEWITELEDKMALAGIDEDIIIVLGSCYAGSFIDALSVAGSRRVILASSADDEPSYRGPREPYSARDGEFFTSTLFNSLGQGFSLKESFTRAVQLTEIHTDSGLSNNPPPYHDNARQHPLLDDDGLDGGSNELSGSGDGLAAAAIELGVGTGADIVRIDPDNFGVVPTDPLSSSENTATLWANVLDDPAIAPDADQLWVEIRSPGIILEQGTEQQTVDLIEVPLAWNAGNQRYDAVYDAFNESGRYTLFYYVKDDAGITSSFERAFVYKTSPDPNLPPGAFSLHLPTDSSALNASAGVVFGWSTATDPDDDPVTYTLEIRTGVWADANLFYRIEGLVKTGIHAVPPTAFADSGAYTWRVTAVDQYGNTTDSAVWGFTVDNTNTGIHYLFEGYVRDIDSDDAIVDAQIQATHNLAITPTNAQGWFMGAGEQGNYDFTVSASGYASEDFTGLPIPTAAPFLYFHLTPLLPPGDLNGDELVDLSDAILAMRIMAGLEASGAQLDADVNGDGKIGIEEVIYILQVAAGLRY